MTLGLCSTIPIPRLVPRSLYVKTIIAFGGQNREAGITRVRSLSFTLAQFIFLVAKHNTVLVVLYLAY